MNHALMFARAGRVVVVRRCETSEGSLLVLIGDDRDVRSYCFSDQSGLMQFQNRLQQFLFDCGWSLLPLSMSSEREVFTPRQMSLLNWQKGPNPLEPIN